MKRWRVAGFEPTFLGLQVQYDVKKISQWTYINIFLHVSRRLNYETLKIGVLKANGKPCIAGIELQTSTAAMLTT